MCGRQFVFWFLENHPKHWNIDGNFQFHDLWFTSTNVVILKKHSKWEMIKGGCESANCHCVKAPYDPPYLPLCPILIPSYHPERVILETFFMHSRYCIVSKLKFTTFQKFLRKYKNCILKMSFKILPLGVYLKHLNICLNYFGFLKICLNLIWKSCRFIGTIAFNNTYIRNMFWDLSYT